MVKPFPTVDRHLALVLLLGLSNGLTLLKSTFFARQRLKRSWIRWQKQREDTYLRRISHLDTFRADADGYLRMGGYEEDISWFRDLLAYRYGENVVGPIVKGKRPYFQVRLSRMFARHRLPHVYDQAERRWAGTDKACLRRWIRPAQHILHTTHHSSLRQ